ncbi:MAG: hypothetical protein RLZZ595_75 [Bacteroidota bacterium]|jgi:putative protein-disulfide isomerase
MKPKIIYCYDAYCGWCFGFSIVIKQFWLTHQDKFDFEVLSGGMIPKESARHIGQITPYLQQAYKTVEETAGVKFGPDFLWHICNPEQSDWFPHSETPAVALSILKEIFPERSIEFASDLQFALYGEGRDLTDPEAYRHLMPKYDLDAESFYKKLNDPEYIEKAHYDFTLVKQLKVNGFPTVFIQFDPKKLYMIARGYSDLESIEKRLATIIAEDNSIKWS